VDRMTKWGYFILYIEEITAEDIAHTYVKEVFSQHGSPKKIISD